MPQFRKRPVVVEAVRLTRPMTVETLEGVMRGEPGDWLITGVAGEQYFCKHEIFKATYEPFNKIAAAYFRNAVPEEHPITSVEPDPRVSMILRKGRKSKDEN